MTPDSTTRIRWGLGAALLALGVVAILALVPDPFLRQRVIAMARPRIDQIANKDQRAVG